MIKLHLRRLFWGLVGAVVVVALAYSALWVALATGTQTIAHDWIAKQRLNGWSVSVKPPLLDGFPFWPVLILEDVAITAPLNIGSWSWSTDRVTVHPATVDLTRLTIRATGRHLIDTPWTPSGPFFAEASVADLGIDLDTEGRLQHSHIYLEQAELQDADRVPIVSAALVDLNFTLAEAMPSPRHVFAQLSGRGDDVRLAINLRPFEPTIRTIQLAADLLGPINPGRLQDALELWRGGGGTLEVRRVFLDWPPLTISADGTMALDDALQPTAALSTRMIGFNDTLNALKAKGIITRSQGASASLVLNLLAKIPPGGDKPELQVPLSVQGQKLSVGPFKIMDMPMIQWD
ncbi:MAG: DUF2125 domain-containing protein [Rhodospirillaceae bacterium]|nr:DUF2125 domain-containing protein [Rhodospirillaceae bacterium]